MLSLVVPSYNNLRHLKNLFDSFVRNSPDDVEYEHHGLLDQVASLEQ